MKRLAVLATAVAALGGAAEARALSLPCGLPPTPLWGEFADVSVGFRMAVFGKPGLVLAASDLAGPAQLRALGAHTVFWYMKLERLAGTPTEPADPATVPAATQRVFERAVASSGCATPVIVLNELFAARQPTPWQPSNALYRQNVLTVLRQLSAKGAVPFLLVPGLPRGRRAPYVGGDATAWWLEAARHAHLVREMHFHAPLNHRLGPIVGSRERRMAMRDALSAFIGIGVPAERMGLMLGFQSGPGRGGRERLSPREAWFEIVKQEALAAKQVVGELGAGSVWSWGWGTFDAAGADPDKPAAACVYLWARDPALCNGPAVAGPRFNDSLTVGQILLPPGVHCRTRFGSITIAALDELAAVAGDRRTALTALLNRLVYASERLDVSSADVAYAEASLVARRFGGDSAAYGAALAEAGLTPALARRLIGDQLRRQAFEAVAQVRHAIPSPGGLTRRLGEQALRTAVCLRDELPAPDVVDWGREFPFLGLEPPSVSIEATRYRARQGTSIQLFGHVESELPRERVTIYARRPRDSAFARLGAAELSADGTWSYRIKPAGTLYYRAVSRSAASLAILVRTRGRPSAVATVSRRPGHRRLEAPPGAGWPAAARVPASGLAMVPPRAFAVATRCASAC